MFYSPFLKVLLRGERYQRIVLVIASKLNSTDLTRSHSDGQVNQSNWGLLFQTWLTSGIILKFECTG